LNEAPDIFCELLSVHLLRSRTQVVQLRRNLVLGLTAPEVCPDDTKGAPDGDPQVVLVAIDWLHIDADKVADVAKEPIVPADGVAIVCGVMGEFLWRSSCQCEGKDLGRMLKTYPATWRWP
jgi:hypothetical protein